MTCFVIINTRRNVLVFSVNFLFESDLYKIIVIVTFTLSKDNIYLHKTFRYVEMQ